VNFISAIRHDSIRIRFCAPNLCNTLTFPFSEQAHTAATFRMSHHFVPSSLGREETWRACVRVNISCPVSPSLSLQCAAHNTAIHYIDRRHLSPSLWILILTSGGIAGFFPISGQTLGVWRDLPSLHTVLGYLKGTGSTLILKTWGFSRGSIFSGESSLCCSMLNWQKLPTCKKRAVISLKHQQYPLSLKI